MTLWAPQVGPSGMTEALQEGGGEVRCVAFGPDGSWLVLFESGAAKWHNIPRKLHKQVRAPRLRPRRPRLVWGSASEH
eukprot:17540-Prorocentrum_minimum.AAC.1